CEKIPFMAIENEGSTERINGIYRYVLCLYGYLINSQKALVTLKDIQVFFAILIPDGETPDKCEEKSYLQIYTNGTGERKKAIQAIQENNFETASDDLYSFHRKSTINKYIRKKALLRDRTLILTWDIKTYASQIGEFAEVLEEKNKVFIIDMTLHWKDDPKPLKQISFTLCWQAFAPDIQVGFNDSDYDWHFIIEKAYHLNILKWMWERMTGKFETKEEILKWKY
ncbi:9106_t:CDS:2, partial [Funneliformis geosporum]